MARSERRRGREPLATRIADESGSFVIPEPRWPVDRARRDGWYFYQPRTVDDPPGHVCVEGHGRMLMLGSYSYLGLIGHPEIEAAASDAIARYGTGTHGVRLLAGTLPLHVELERALASFTGCEDAAVFSSGFLTNLSVITALVGRGDTVYVDRLDHASIVDACRLSGADVIRFQHGNVADLETKLRRGRGNRLVVADAVFSMDGDVFDVPRALAACRRTGALLMVDEAHALGVIGATGRGVEEHFGLAPGTIDLRMGSLGKAIPSCGGFVAASAALVDVIRHNGRGYVYSAAPPPAAVAAALASLGVIARETDRVRRLQENARHFVDRLLGLGVRVAVHPTPIVPVLCGDDEIAFAVAHACQRAGVFVQAIPSPVVPAGTARLRCCVNALHTPADLARAADIVAAACRTHGASAVLSREAVGDA